jgi:neopullulanase
VTLRALAVVLLAQACCQAPPEWTQVPAVTVAEGVRVPVSLSAYATGDHLSFEAEATEGIAISLVGDVLQIEGEADFDGYSTVTVVARDQCGQESTTNISVDVSDRQRADACVVRLSTRSSSGVVAVAGEFNDWSADEDLMESDGAGGFTVELQLSPGAYAYKFVDNGSWRCDADEPRVQCDEGQEWDPECPTGAATCNSLLLVPDCGAPRLAVTTLDIDRESGAVEVSGTASVDVEGAWATLDGEAIDAWGGKAFAYRGAGLSAGRHTLRFGASGAEALYVPFWLDDRDWATGLLYFAFVDRFANGDPSNDAPEGADVDFAGGDWAGLRSRLDYLDDLGVTVLWITAPLDNAEGAWDGQCAASFAGYHGYWPGGTGLEEHFGDEAELRALIEEAHALGMRVMVDWVANHVHEDHDLYLTRPEWFNERHLCTEDDDGDGVTNWDQRPETCWFAAYLPDIDYTQTDPLVRQVDEAIDLAKDWEIDGFRIDAVKHMPHSVFVNTQVRIREEIEHRDAGGTEDFRTIGETFDSYWRIAEYLGDEELDSQFDFPLYYAVLAAFAREEIGLSDGDSSLQASLAASQAAYGGATMSTFLGNHDVERFITHAAGEVSSAGGDGACGDDGELRAAASSPTGAEPYARLRLAWTFLLTSPGLPLVYYGDEIGLPGYADPDNRQVMKFDEALSPSERATLAHVQALGQARREHPAFALGTTVPWWENESDVWAYARAHAGDGVIVLLNRGDSARTLTNGLAFAGLPPGGYRDVLTDDVFTSDDDVLAVSIPARSSRVLVPR